MLRLFPIPDGDRLATQAIEALVSLYGAADAPTYAERTPPPSVIEWWAQRVQKSPAGLTVSVDQGTAAVTSWRERQAKLHPLTERR
ncbi:MAG: hypothetical protein H3C62_03940 [Gemmatimonadaceae bacterium]|nr:hypothetical protein [Gemmatimonadaceae bacterium]